MLISNHTYQHTRVCIVRTVTCGDAIPRHPTPKRGNTSIDPSNTGMLRMRFKERMQDWSGGKRGLESRKADAVFDFQELCSMRIRFLRGLSLTTILFGLGYAVLLSNGLSWSQNAANPASGMGAVSAVAPAHVGSSGTSMMASVLLSNGFQQIAIFEQSKQTLAIYHINPASGDIQLKSVRRLDADFALQEFNLSEPTPSTIRKNVR